MKSSVDKVEKYIARIDKTLRAETLPVREILSLHDNLMFAANVAPFGRPFLAALSNLTAGRNNWEVVELTELTRLSLRIWKRLLVANHGLSFDFILGNLQRSKYDIFVDASTT